VKGPGRILHFRNCRGIATITGPERRLLSLFGGIDPAAFELHLLCLFNPEGPRPAFDRALWERTVGDRHQLHALQMTRAVSAADWFALRALVRRARIQAIATHDARSNVVGLVAARTLGLPSMAFAHGWVNWTRPVSRERLYAGLEAQAIRLADRIVVASRAMERDLVGRGIPASTIRYIPHGIDLEQFRPGAGGSRVRSELGLAPDTPIVGTVGRLQPWKGHRYFLEAAAQVARQVPAATFLVVGDITCEADREYREQILALASALGVRDRCVFTGTRTDIADVMRALDVFVLSSTREPLGWVLLEAQACGTPVVCTGVDGTPEAVRDGSTAVLVPPADGAALAGAVLRLLGDRARREAMGAAGRRWIEDRFSIRSMLSASEALYRELLANAGDGR
jgi:glycosyltransferase involved in cell wall biosynthesis